MSLSPYHQELLADVQDWKTFEAGLDALARIAGMSEKSALDFLVAGATPEQRQRVIARMTRLEEYYKLPADVRAKLKQEPPS